MKLFGKSISWSTFTTKKGKVVSVQRNVYVCPVCRHETTSYWSMVNHVVRIHKLDIPIRKK
jgi:hypothetical protein